MSLKYDPASEPLHILETRDPNPEGAGPADAAGAVQAPQQGDAQLHPRLHFDRERGRPRYPERVFSIDNLLVRIHLIVEMIWWTGLAPWEFEFPFSGSLVCTFLVLYKLLNKETLHPRLHFDRERGRTYSAIPKP